MYSMEKELRDRAWAEWLAFAPFGMLVNGEVPHFNDFFNKWPVKQRFTDQEIEDDLDSLRAWANSGG